MSIDRLAQRWLIAVVLLGLSAPAWAQVDAAAPDPADAILSGEDPADQVLDDPTAEEPPADPADDVLADDSPVDETPAADDEPPADAEPMPDPADAALDEAPPAAAPPAADPAEAALAGAPAAATPPAPAAATDAPMPDPADALVDDPADEALGEDTSPPDIADQVLAEQETAPTAATDEAYSILRKTIEADVNIRSLQDEGEMIGGILIRRGRKGARGGPARLGFTGVFRAISADLPPAQSFRFGSHFGFYHMPELWDDTSQSHLDAIGFFAYSVREDLELRIAGVASGHHSGTIQRVGQDALFQTLGDVYVGGKYAYEIFPFLHVAGVADLRFFTQVGSFLLRPDATSLSLLATGTLDLYRARWFPKLTVPIRTHLTLGYTLDRSANVLGDVETQNASTFGGFGLSPGDNIPIVLAGEVILEPFSYFIEYIAEPTVNNRAEGAIASRPNFAQSPMRFTLGVKYNPIENILLDGAIDLSYGLQQATEIYGQRERPGPPYMLHFGITYEWNPEGFEVLDLRGRIVGLVVDAETGQPLGGAVVEYLDTEEVYSAQQAATSTGTFETYRVPPGEILLRVQAEGYEPVIINPVLEGKEIREEKIFLRRPDQAESLSGALVGSVVDENGQPVTASVRFLGVDMPEVRSDPVDGSFVKILPEGEYRVEISAEGYETKVYDVPIQAQRKTTVQFQLISGANLGAMGGQVADTEGRPLQATVVFLDAQIDPLQTDARGQFEKVLPPGTYAIEVRARGFVPKQYRLPIEIGKKTVIQVPLEEEQAMGMLAGRILDEAGRPLPGVVSFAKPDVAPVPADPETGQFQAVLQAGTYEITIDAADHEPKAYRIPVLAGKKTVQDFRLARSQESRDQLAYREGDEVVLGRDVEFEFGGTQLREDAYPVLDAVANVMLTLPSNASVRIEAHTHNLGPSEANLRLSSDRAEQVAQYLISLGIPRSRLTPIGRGEDAPKMAYDSPEGQADPERAREVNERVEFLITR